MEGTKGVLMRTFNSSGFRGVKKNCVLALFIIKSAQYFKQSVLQFWVPTELIWLGAKGKWKC